MPYTDDTSTTETTYAERRAVALRRFMDDAGFDYSDVLDALMRVALHDAAQDEDNDRDSAAWCRRVAQAVDAARQRVEELQYGD